MPNEQNVDHWINTISRRYENYLKTSFYFKDPMLRASFESALQKEGNLLKGPFAKWLVVSIQVWTHGR